MTTMELAARMGVTQSRVSELERAELDGALQLSTLERVAAALRCKVLYVLVPREPLEAIVFHQAWEKAASLITRSAPHLGPLVEEALHSADPSPEAIEVSEQIEDLAFDLVDRRGLWRMEGR
jgi:predicted DNA-binding mobile mystery protein A